MPVTELAPEDTRRPSSKPISPAGPRRGRRRPAGERRLRVRTLRRSLSPLLALILWQVLSAVGLIAERTLPPPTKVLDTARGLIESGRLQEHLVVSLERVAWALLFGVSIGVVIALTAGLSRLADDLLDPLMQMFRTIPVLALVPLLILWFGIGETSKVIIVAIGVVFPVYLNTYAGIRAVDSKLVEVGTVVGLGRWGQIRHIVLPGALPGFLTGLRYSMGIAWLLLVISEQVNATSGVGFLMNDARALLRTDIIVVGIFIYAGAGLLSDAIVRTLERRLLSWRRGLEAR